MKTMLMAFIFGRRKREVIEMSTHFVVKKSRILISALVWLFFGLGLAFFSALCKRESGEIERSD